ncbi:hypothetical protein PRUB_b1291 [Pseudoalteromonas rubra]|uniref:Uncharacterized protein n=1 Tax=Pseudoalteromonas rubra TaxID=43658 RepID=A0A8T0C213_9GAMM|nr:hypothetical protein PRUB_b1291 [Pseudoalteromonas rubra]
MTFFRFNSVIIKSLALKIFKQSQSDTTISKAISHVRPEKALCNSFIGEFCLFNSLMLNVN